MDNRKCGVPEESWIDYHLGRLAPAHKAALESHRETCPDCAACCEEWSRLLSRTPGPEPSLRPWQRRLLRTAVRWRGLKAKLKPGFRLKRPVGVTAMLGAAILTCAVLLLHLPKQDPKLLHSQRYAQQHVPSGEAVMNRPDTVMYRSGTGIGAAHAPLTGGTTQTVWINVRTREVFLLLDGMLPSDKLDVQAWALIQGRKANLGVLEFNENHAHLYSRGVRPELWEAIALTIEPKGGSESPTAPDAAVVAYLPMP